MPFSLHLTATAKATLEQLERDSGLAKRLNAVRKTLIRVESAPSRPSEPQISVVGGSNGEDVFEAYAEQSTPAAYRVFWCYGPEKGQITIIAIARHP